MAYVGIHLTDKVAPVGSPWSSRTPRIVDDLGTLFAHDAAADNIEADDVVREWLAK
jgi:hypothetical protein